jgi:hypothetical protein
MENWRKYLTEDGTTDSGRKNGHYSRDTRPHIRFDGYANSVDPESGTQGTLAEDDEEEAEVSPPGLLYHATAPTRLTNIMKSGLGQGESKFQGNVGQAGISTASDIDALAGGDFGNLILVLDTAKMGANYKFIPTDYWGDDREKEIRVMSKDESAAVIDPSAISKLIFIRPEIPRFEVKWLLSKYNIPIESLWHGETKTYDTGAVAA